MDQISISKFKATCLKLLAEVSRKKTSLIVTKNGEPLVVIYAAKDDGLRPALGFAKNTVSKVGDLIQPVSPESEWGD